MVVFLNFLYITYLNFFGGVYTVWKVLKYFMSLSLLSSNYGPNWRDINGWNFTLLYTGNTCCNNL